MAVGEKKFSDCDIIETVNLAEGDFIIYLDKSDTTGGPEGTIKLAKTTDFRNFKSLVASVNYLSVAGVDTDTSFFSYIPLAINSQGPFACNPGEQFIFYTTQWQNDDLDTGNNNVIVTYFQIYTGNLIVGGSDPAYQITAANVMLSGGPKSLDPEKDAELFIELGDIAAAAVEEAFNLGDTENGVDWSIEGEKFITCIINDIDKIYRFIGLDGDYGPTGLTATAADFQDLANEGTPEAFEETTPREYRNDSANIILNNHEGLYGHGNWTNQVQFIANYSKLGGLSRKQINSAVEPTVRTTQTATAELIEAGELYTIKTVGTTDFTAFGAENNNVGTVFISTSGDVTGSGEVYVNAVQRGGENFAPNENMYLYTRCVKTVDSVSLIPVLHGVEYWFEKLETSKVGVIKDTGTEISLNNTYGNLCNTETPCDETTLTIVNAVSGGNTRILINAASEPTFNLAATKIKGADFIANENMYLVVFNNGYRNEFWFEEI